MLRKKVKKLSPFVSVFKLASKRRRTIGIAILKTTPAITASLKKASRLVDIVVYGQRIPGFKNISSRSGDLGVRMLRDFQEGRIHQFVRGQVDDFAMVAEAKKLYNIDKKLRRVCFSCLQDAYGRQFILTGVSNPDLYDLAEKKRVTIEIAKWLKSIFGFKPKIAVMATCRPGSYGKNPEMSKTFDEAESLVKHLKFAGYYAENVNIELERAVEFAHLIVPTRGTIGNQIFRTLYYLGGGKILFCPTYFPGKLIYEDNSRNEQDYYGHIVFAAALANS